ncbi:hypothetical protein [Shewanella algae]|uniref:hypothetical protein n=1 Tax=Shewanella algae TaxID=38313 RepID=UPI001AAD08C3|nr:hypothetical protein [Shewanella algae]QTE80822.1 hypothetical protein JKK46_14090 [Shewanella algae]
MKELSFDEVKNVSGGFWGMVGTAFTRGWNMGTSWQNGGAESFGRWAYNDGYHRVSMK